MTDYFHHDKIVLKRIEAHCIAIDTTGPDAVIRYDGGTITLVGVHDFDKGDITFA